MEEGPKQQEQNRLPTRRITTLTSRSCIKILVATVECSEFDTITFLRYSVYLIPNTTCIETATDVNPPFSVTIINLGRVRWIVFGRKLASALDLLSD